MAIKLSNEILEKIFLELNWNNLRKCKDVCSSWNEIITKMIQNRKIEDKITTNLFTKDARIEITLVDIGHDSRILFTGNGITLISEQSHVNVDEDDLSWTLNVNDDQGVLVRLQKTSS